VLGRPESYFRGPDEALWAARFGLSTDGSLVRDYPAFVRAVRETATTANGVFAARVMWGSVEGVVERLGRSPGESDLATLERALGPLSVVHLRREDVVGQAVSWCRAEQTRCWQHGDVATGPPPQDLDAARALVRTIRDHDAAWRSWFDRQGVRPHVVTYEDVVHEPRATVEGIAAHLGVAVLAHRQPRSPHRRQADGVNAEWAAALRAVLDD
jgi:LPS sulfotransferase NodH